jgi:hypothetical protein
VKGEEAVTREISLVVNNTPISLDYFIAGYIDHIVGGIVASLKDTGEINNLELNIDNDGIVVLNLNGVEVPLNFFSTEIIKSTLEGVLKPLKGVTGGVKTMELKIAR